MVVVAFERRTNEKKTHRFNNKPNHVKKKNSKTTIAINVIRVSKLHVKHQSRYNSRLSSRNRSVLLQSLLVFHSKELFKSVVLQFAHRLTKCYIIFQLNKLIACYILTSEASTLFYVYFAHYNTSVYPE